MKITILSDMEGVSGYCWGCFGLPDLKEDEYVREVMTAEIAAVVRTLQAEGIDDIFVFEAHKMQPGVLPENINVGRDLVGGLKGSDALFFVGQHGPAGNREAVAAHTHSSISIFKMTLNGMDCGELTFEAAHAGAMGIPTVFVSGERQTGIEAKNNLPPLEFVMDSEGLSNHSAICRPFKDLEKELVEKTRLALGRIGKTPPFDIGKVEMRITHRYDGMSEKTAQYSFAQREGHEIVYRADNMLEMYRLRKTDIVGRDFWCRTIPV